jgi:hypothetical protein
MKKYVYVIYDPLHEKVICVHNKNNMECNKCKTLRIKRFKQCYPLEEHKRLIQIKTYEN